MKALVIGGTGPTGPFLVEGLLKRGYEVSILHRGEHEVEFSVQVEHIHADPHFVETLEQGLGTRKFDLAIAAYGRLRHVAKALRKQTSRLVAIGGMSYQSLADGMHNPSGAPVPIPETAPLFADEKVSRFMYLIAASEQDVMRTRNEGYYQATVIRYPRVYGPRQPAPKEWSIVRRILDKRRYVIIPDNGLKLVRRGYAENVAHAVLLIVDNPEKTDGQTYNVGDERVLSLREWVQIIAHAMDYELELVSVPFDLARCARPYSERAHHEVTDIAKIQTDVGYKDLLPATEAVGKTVKWYLQNRPEPGGECERQLDDAFDYEAEDRTAAACHRFVEETRKDTPASHHHRHPYAHPQSPFMTE